MTMHVSLLMSEEPYVKRERCGKNSNLTYERMTFLSRYDWYRYKGFISPNTSCR